MCSQQTLEKDTEISLVLAAQQGDREAFGQLVQRYERSVYATAYRRLNNHAEAQEVCQEVLVKAMEKIGQLRSAECFGGWLRSMTGRMAINRALRKAPSVAPEPQSHGRRVRGKRNAALGRPGPRTADPGPGRPAPAGPNGPRHADGVLRRRPIADRNERSFRRSGWHDQAPAARRPQAAGQGAGGIGRRLKCAVWGWGILVERAAGSNIPAARLIWGQIEGGLDGASAGCHARQCLSEISFGYLTISADWLIIAFAIALVMSVFEEGDCNLGQYRQFATRHHRTLKDLPGIPVCRRGTRQLFESAGCAELGSVNKQSS